MQLRWEHEVALRIRWPAVGSDTVSELACETGAAINQFRVQLSYMRLRTKDLVAIFVGRTRRVLFFICNKLEMVSSSHPSGSGL
jgi:hypothetical protein